LPSGREAGIASPVPGLIGTIQAAEVMKLLLGKGDLLVGRMVLYDMLAMKFREIRIAKDPGCSLCGRDAGEEFSG
jgi:adenylyltransferase/sulfurtransferase